MGIPRFVKMVDRRLVGLGSLYRPGSRLVTQRPAPGAWPIWSKSRFRPMSWIVACPTCLTAWLRIPLALRMKRPGFVRESNIGRNVKTPA